MITTTHNAKDLFVVRRKNALAGNPAWADLTIDSNRTLRKELARGAGLYAIHFRGTLLYVGKFCGKQSDPFDGRVCDIRWARHIGTLTLRDRRISLSEGRCKQLRGSMTSPLVDIVSAMQASTIYQNRGRATSINRALFAAEHWAEFARIEDEAGPPRVRMLVAPIELDSLESKFTEGGGRLWSLWAKAGAVGNASVVHGKPAGARSASSTNPQPGAAPKAPRPAALFLTRGRW